MVKKIIEQDEKNHAEITKFLVSKDDDEVDEIMGYAELMDIFARQEADEVDGERLWRFKEIIRHEGPLHPESDKNKYMGSKYNVLVA